MQKSAVSTLSASQKDALLDQFKTIVDAGELTMRSDSDDSRKSKALNPSFTLNNEARNVLQKIWDRSWAMEGEKGTNRSDSGDRQWTRWDSAIDRISIKYGLHLDAQKALSRLGRKLGKKCGKGWISPERRCKAHYTGKKLNDAGKSSSANLADRIRARKGLSTIRSRNGKTASGEWDIGAAFAPAKELQSSVRAKRTSPAKTKMSPDPDRASRMMNKESERARINWGRSTGDWKQTPDSTAAMDFPKPKQSPQVTATPIESGKSLKSLFAEADRIGSKYQDEPTSLDERRSAKQGADRILRESGVTAAVERSTGVASMEEKRSANRMAMGTATPKRPVSQRPDGSLMMRKHTERQAKSQAKVFFPQGFTLDQVPATWEGTKYVPAHWLAQQKAATESPSEASRKLFENAPVMIASSQRKSGEPRKRGRSVD